VQLAEDDADLLDLAAYALRKYGYDVVGVTNGTAAIERWRQDEPELVLLDINLPGVNGLDVCRAIRAKSSTPIIIVTARDDEKSVVDGFDCGADDFVSKPVRYRELAMRMRAVVRRHSPGPIVASSTLARSGALCVELANYEVHQSGQRVPLTRLEARTLFFLAANAGRAVTSGRLIELVWNYEGGDPFSLRTHISHIRRKLGVTKYLPGYISSVAHVGYRLEVA
jgi:two-component system, OmpR family, response regulator RegX3